MFKENDIVMHPKFGVCKVTGIEKQSFIKGNIKEYYILNPIYEDKSSKIYIPLDSKIELRKLLSIEDIKDILKKVDLSYTLWIDNDSKRSERFKNIIKQANHIDLIHLIVDIHQKKDEKELQGKKLHISDQNILKEATKIIHQEFAYALNLDVENVASFIMEELDIK